MKKFLNFLKVFVPAFLLAMLAYTFFYQPNKAEVNGSVQQGFAGAAAALDKQIDRIDLPKLKQGHDKGEQGLGALPEGKLKITMLDVNHGDAILLQDSKQTILVDTGHNKNRELVLKKLADRKIKRINTVVLTHHHADHIGNILKLAGKYGVGRIYDNGLINQGNATSVKLGEILSKGNYKNKRLQAGDKISFGDGFYMEVLAPGAFLDKSLRTDFNNNSIVMKLYYGSFTMMFTGDIENPTEAALAKRYGTALKADVLKVAHHGSKTSSNYRFISRVKPKYALISCGAFEEYHHPNKNVVGSLEHLGAKVYNTHTHGDLTIVTDGKDFSFKAEKK